MASRKIALVVTLALHGGVAADKALQETQDEPVTPGRRLGACDDSTTWNLDNARKDCDWVGIDTDKRCWKKNAAQLNGKMECPVTCGTCPAPACADGCCDSTVWRFQNKERKDCDWVAAKNTEKRCKKSGTGGVKASKACKVACATCPKIPDLVGTISTYPEYTGSATVTGTCSASDSGDEFSFSGDLSDLAADSSGGYHIHSGTTCADASLVGGHYFNNGGDCDAEDPWFGYYGATWDSDSNGDAMPVNIAPASKTATGGGPYTIDGPTCPVTGRACVVHEAGSGTRIGCGLLEPVEPALEGVLSSYPGYSGGLTVTGTCTADVVDGEFVFGAKLAGLEPSATGGIHIHAGTSCATAGDVGGHYFDSSGDCDAPDPWFSVYGATWVSDGAGAATHENIGPSDALGGGPFTINGANCPVLGRTCVVHDSTGARVACAVLIDGD